METAPAGSMNLHDQATIPPGQGISSPGSPLTTPALNAGTMLGDYELLEELGRGGMGVVFKARQRSLNRIVALKMILAGRLASAQDVKRFRAEAEAAAALDHPGIIPIYEVDQAGGQNFFSMAFVEGENLATVVSQTPMLPQLAADVVARLAEAVEYAHQRGIIHRDLKPSNVLIDAAGQPRITDFGLAKRITQTESSTSSNDVCGTVSYMPPEQAEGKTDKIGPPTDVYALGATLYCLVTGRPPFQSANPLDTLLQVVQQEPVPPRQLNAAIPVDLETICLKCLAKEPGRRYSTAAELGTDLQHFLNDEPILARPPGAWEQLRRWSRRNPGLALSMTISSGAVLTLLLVSVLFNFLLQGEKLSAEAAMLDAQRLQRSTQLLLDQVAELKQSERAFNVLRYGEFGRACALAQRISVTNSGEEIEPLRHELAPLLAAFESGRDERIQPAAAQLSVLASGAIALNDPLWHEAAEGLAKVCRESWQSNTQAVSAIREQVQQVVAARFLGLASDLTRDGMAAATMEQLRDLYHGELAIVATPEVLLAADELMELLNPAGKPPSRSQLLASVAELRSVVELGSSSADPRAPGRAASE